MGLSAENTKKGKLQRACLELLREHEADGAIPTSIRFLFYELLDRQIIPKSYRKPDGSEAKRTPSQDISVAVTALREEGLVPWHWINDETRTLTEWRYSDSVYRYVEQAADLARIDLWDESPPPLIICESRSLSGVLTPVAREYLTPIAATNGQTGGFLHTEVAPLVEDSDTPRRVIYLGDFDLAGGHIEENTRKVLEGYGPLMWKRLAITEVQVHARGLPIVSKLDYRHKPAQYFDAVETEALGQQEIRRLLTERLDALLPEPLDEARERQTLQRRDVKRLLGEER